MKVNFEQLKRGDKIVVIGTQKLDAPHVVAAKPERDRVSLVNPVKGGTERWLYRDNPSLMETFLLEIERPEPKPVHRYFGDLILVGRDGIYHTPDGKFRVWRQDDYQTECMAPHPVRGKNGTGFQCPGGEAHFYSRWDIWDIERNDYVGGNGPNALMTFTEAASELAAHLAKKKER